MKPTENFNLKEGSVPQIPRRLSFSKFQMQVVLPVNPSWASEQIGDPGEMKCWTRFAMRQIMFQNSTLVYIVPQLSTWKWHYCAASVKSVRFGRVCKPRKFKEGIGSLFDPCVNAIGQRPYWPPQQIPPLNFLGVKIFLICNIYVVAFPRWVKNWNMLQFLWKECQNVCLVIRIFRNLCAVWPICPMLGF